MLKASNNILCKNLTIGASSTSEVSTSPASAGVSIDDTSNSKSPPTKFSIASVTVVAFRSTSRDNLSNSAITQSTPNWVENLIFSAAA